MRKAVLLLLMILPFNSGWSQSPKLNLEQKCIIIDSMINTWDSRGIFNGGVIIKQKEKVIYQRSAGYANFEKRISNSDTTQFNLASVSKPFTAIAILQLVDKKKLKLTDPFVRYFPDFPYSSVTITQLLSHTSGLPEVDQFEKPYIAVQPDEVLSNQQIYADLVNLNVPLLAAAGEQHYYNNLNYILLALLAEKISKTTFPEYMKKNVFAKAEMTSSYVRQRMSANTARYFRPTFYDTIYQHVDSVTNRKIFTDHNLGGTYGDNNIITTLTDMVRFDNALNNGRLIPESLVKEMYRPVKLTNGNYFFNGGTKTYTLGWNVNEKNRFGQFVAWHDGSLVGLTTILFKNFTDSITYIMYENKNQPNFFQRFLAISNVVDNIKPTEVSQKKSLVRDAYGPTLVNKGPEYALVLFNSLKADINWYFDEFEMNELGYQLLLKSDFEKHSELAIEVFRLNTFLAPESSNVYDSYAEGLIHMGLKKEAILMYQKALSINPANGGARDNLKRLKEEVTP